jgi:hypothetical protein
MSDDLLRRLGKLAEKRGVGIIPPPAAGHRQQLELLSLAREWVASPQRLRGVARHIAVIASTSNVPEPTITPAKPNIRASY